MRWWVFTSSLVGILLHAVATPPVNDAFAGAIPLPDLAVRSANAVGVSVLDTRYQTPNLASATVETNEPPIDGVAGAHSLWYSWTAPVTCRCVFAMLASMPVGVGVDATPHLGVYTGDQLDRLHLESRLVPPPRFLGYETNRWRLGEFLAQQGNVYRLRVDVTGRNATNVNCFIGLTLAATNDAFASRKVFSVKGSGTSVPFSTAAASLENGEPPTGAQASLWFEFSVSEAGAYDVYTDYFEIELPTLFQGDRLDSLQRIGWPVAEVVDSTLYRGRTNSITRFYGNPGERYILLVTDDTVIGGYNGLNVVRSPLYDPVPAPSVRLGQQLIGPPRLNVSTMRPALMVEGKPNRLYDIQTSTDLREWRHWQWYLSTETNSAVDLENGTPPDPFLRVVAPD